jgi:hypothetical protein
MMTQKFWYALNHPPARHPLFLRTVLLPPPSRRRFVSSATLMIDFVLGVSVNTPTLLFLLMPFFLLLIGITYGVDCALRISTTIAKEHESNTFDVLALSPGGVWGTNWALSTSSLYRNRDFERLYSIMRSAIIAGVTMTVIIGLIAFLGLAQSRPARLPQPSNLDLSFVLAEDVISVLALIAAIYVEYVQSTVLGSLVGLLIPTVARNRLDASLWAFGGFLLLQIMTYVFAWLIGFTILPTLFTYLQMGGWFAGASLAVLRLAAFFLVREAIIAALWRLLAGRLNAREIELATQPTA